MVEDLAKAVMEQKMHEIGYPGNQCVKLTKFYKWLLKTGLDTSIMNNAGDPYHPYPGTNTLVYERTVIDFFGSYFGFDMSNIWGIVTFCGTDGNNHGIYFGVQYLKSKSKEKPIVYVSDAAHYSNMRLADAQNLEIRLIKTNTNGEMLPEDLEKQLDPTRPVLMIYAVGTTFKGAIDNQKELNKVIEKKNPVAVYRHIDAALFGGYLPFTEYSDLVDRNKCPFDSIAVSGHKFFGMDEPAGIFITTRDVLKAQNPFHVTYLNEDMPMLNCSRSSITPLKFWWLIQHEGDAGWRKQANQLLSNAQWLYKKLKEIEYPCYMNKASNTVFFTCPPQVVVDKYHLATDYDARLGGRLAHVVVMQHVSKKKLKEFLADLILVTKNRKKMEK